MIGLPPELLWASIELMKNTAIGHDVDELAHFFASLNFADSSAIFNAMNEASILGSRIDPPLLANDTTLQTSLTNAQNNRDMDTGADEYWDMETDTASFRTTFDPETRRRRAIVANARQATLYGIHPEEFQVSRIDFSIQPQRRTFSEVLLCTSSIFKVDWSYYADYPFSNHISIRAPSEHWHICHLFIQALKVLLCTSSISKVDWSYYADYPFSNHISIRAPSEHSSFKH
jgi:hypothetical protein